MYGIFSRCNVIVFGVVAGMVAVAGCDWNASSAGIRQQGNGRANGEKMSGPDNNVLPAWYRSERPVLRYQVDGARGRLWVLNAAGVELYSVATQQKVAQIALPGWTWVGEKFSCAPDLAIGPIGEAVVSSNVVPTLWRIDPASLAVSEHELRLDENTGRDIGFTGLVYSAEQRAYLAVSAFQGSLWRIDPLLRRAQNIPLSAPLANACNLAIRPPEPEKRASRFVGLCVRSNQGDWSVNLAPDQRSGYVRAGYCRT